MSGPNDKILGKVNETLEAIEKTGQSITSVKKILETTNNPAAPPASPGSPPPASVEPAVEAAANAVPGDDMEAEWRAHVENSGDDDEEPAERFAVGETVKIRGLTKNPDLNGTTGDVVSYIEASGRFQVLPPNGNSIFVLPGNLEPASPQPAKGGKRRKTRKIRKRKIRKRMTNKNRVFKKKSKKKTYVMKRNNTKNKKR